MAVCIAGLVRHATRHDAGICGTIYMCHTLSFAASLFVCMREMKIQYKSGD